MASSVDGSATRTRTPYQRRNGPSWIPGVRGVGQPNCEEIPRESHFRLRPRCKWGATFGHPIYARCRTPRKTTEKTRRWTSATRPTRSDVIENAIGDYPHLVEKWNIEEEYVTPLGNTDSAKYRRRNMRRRFPKSRIRRAMARLEFSDPGAPGRENGRPTGPPRR